MHGAEAKAAAFNSVARTCARGGMLDEGLSLLERMQASSIDVGRATVCLPCICKNLMSILHEVSCLRERSACKSWLPTW